MAVARAARVTRHDVGGGSSGRVKMALAASHKTKTLDLSLNMLKCVPAPVLTSYYLIEINLDQNQISALQPSVGNLSSLTSLSLRWNLLDSLPPQLGQLTALQRLDVSFNKLTSVPAQLGRLVSLQSLVLNDNEMKALPAALAGCVALEEMQLQYNRLSSLPSELCRLTALKSLNLAGNNDLVCPPMDVAILGVFAVRDYLTGELAKKLLPAAVAAAEEAVVANSIAAAAAVGRRSPMAADAVVHQRWQTTIDDADDVIAAAMHALAVVRADEMSGGTGGGPPAGAARVRDGRSLGGGTNGGAGAGLRESGASGRRDVPVGSARGGRGLPHSASRFAEGTGGLAVGSSGLRMGGVGRGLGVAASPPAPGGHTTSSPTRGGATAGAGRGRTPRSGRRRGPAGALPSGEATSSDGGRGLIGTSSGGTEESDMDIVRNLLARRGGGGMTAMFDALVEEKAIDDIDTSAAAPAAEARVLSAAPRSPPLSPLDASPVQASPRAFRRPGSPLRDCGICMDAPKDTLLAPCGHIFACYSCSNRLLTRGDRCPVCRGKLQAVYRAFHT